MSGLDAGLAGVLTPEQVAAQVSGPPGPFTVRARLLPATPQAAPPAPAPEPQDPRSLEELTAARDAALESLNALLERRLRLAAELEAVERRIAEARDLSPLSPEASRDARAERAALTVELAELDVLVERANVAHDRASQVAQAALHRQRAAEARAQLADLRQRVVDADAAIEAAIGALLDAEDARAALVEDGRAIAAAIAALPPEYHGADTGPKVWSMGALQAPDPKFIPAGIEFDRTKIAALKNPHPRKRRYLLGL